MLRLWLYIFAIMTAIYNHVYNTDMYMHVASMKHVHVLVLVSQNQLTVSVNCVQSVNDNVTLLNPLEKVT